MLDLDDLPSTNDEPAPRPTTPQDGWAALVLVGTFVVWLPTYLIVVRPLINAVLFQYISSYPAMVHLVPIFAVPWGVMEAFSWLCKTRSPPSRDSP